MNAAALTAVMVWLLTAAVLQIHLAAPRTPAPSHPHTRQRARRPNAAPTATQWADLLAAVAADVRTGTALGPAFTAATHRLPTDGLVVRRGGTIAALGEHTDLHPDEAVVVHVVLTTHALGGAVAAALDGAAAVLRERSLLRAEAAVHSAQARLSARVLTLVPLAFATWSLLTSRSFRSAWGSAPGLLSVAVGAGLNVLGWYWMRRIVHRATP